MLDASEHPSHIRRGRFLWMIEPSRKDYLEGLRKRIAEGFYFSETILSKVADELAPHYSESARNE